MLTDTQKTQIVTALRAETAPAIIAALQARDDTTLQAWCNGPGLSDAWNEAMRAQALFDVTDITKFDGITAGKRDAWRLMLDFTPIDFGRESNQKAIADVWGNANGVAVLQACTRKALRVEAYLGGTLITTNTVAALKLNSTGSISLNDLSGALNANP